MAAAAMRTTEKRGHVAAAASRAWRPAVMSSSNRRAMELTGRRAVEMRRQGLRKVRFKMSQNTSEFVTKYNGSEYSPPLTGNHTCSCEGDAAPFHRPRAAREKMWSRCVHGGMSGFHYPAAQTTHCLDHVITRQWTAHLCCADHERKYLEESGGERRSWGNASGRKAPDSQLPISLLSSTALQGELQDVVLKLIEMCLFPLQFPPRFIAFEVPLVTPPLAAQLTWSGSCRRWRSTMRGRAGEVNPGTLRVFCDVHTLAFSRQVRSMTME